MFLPNVIYVRLELRRDEDYGSCVYRAAGDSLAYVLTTWHREGDTNAYVNRAIAAGEARMLDKADLVQGLKAAKGDIHQKVNEFQERIRELNNQIAAFDNQIAVIEGEQA